MISTDAHRDRAGLSESESITTITTKVQTIRSQIGPIATDIPQIIAEIPYVTADVRQVSSDIRPVAKSQVTTEIGSVAAEVDPIATEIRSVTANIKSICADVSPVGTNVCSCWTGETARPDTGAEGKAGPGAGAKPEAARPNESPTKTTTAKASVETTAARPCERYLCWKLPSHL